jgi:hypothetical protein
VCEVRVGFYVAYAIDKVSLAGLCQWAQDSRE